MAAGLTCTDVWILTEPTSALAQPLARLAAGSGQLAVRHGRSPDLVAPVTRK
jgi:hypothetical protein